MPTPGLAGSMAVLERARGLSTCSAGGSVIAMVGQWLAALSHMLQTGS